VRHVFNSRSLEFAGEIHALTGGAGVDVVLNSLNGDFIPANVSVLAPRGRFVEIGKAGIWTPEQMAAARPDVAYFPFYLGDLDTVPLQALYGQLLDGVAKGELRPLPRTTYPLAEAEQAFRYMAQAKHIGKVVLRLERPDEVTIGGNATYLVTGAFGGLGRMVAEWLGEQGARHLVLVGRRGAHGDGAAFVAQLEARGISVQAIAADVGDAAAVARVVASVRPNAPLRGVIHAAGVIDDGVLAQQTRARFETVFGPKIAGAWNLHRETRHLPLDFFLLFSSMVTIVGAPGQGNYAAASAMLDALAAFRRAKGLTGTTINWGPWADVGMSAAVSEQDRKRWHHQGISMIGRREGTALLERFLNHTPAQVAVLPVQWGVLLQQFPAGKVPPLYEDLARTGSSRAARTVRPAALLDRLKEAPASRRPAIVTEQLNEVSRKILGLDANTALDPHRPLQEYGLDSLMAVELRNSIGALLDRTLPATLLFKYPTMKALTDFVLESIPQTAPAATEATSTDTDAADVASLSDDEVKRLLAEELDALSGLLDDV
jgi:NAD(P)-dependent dehydrogenase (short-subunit alcohol dehydrogenase family)/acyl carrier protein